MAGETEAKKVWPSGYQEATSIDDFEFIMTGKNGQPLTKFQKDKYKQYLTTTGQRMKSVPAGALPAGPSDKEMYMVLETSGTWSFGGNTFVNYEYQTLTLWWDKTTYSVDNIIILPKGKDGKDGRDITDWEAKAYAYSSVLPKVSFLVFKDGAIWENNSATLATDIPGVSAKWVLKTGVTEAGVNKVLVKDKILTEIINKLVLRDDFDSNTGWIPVAGAGITPVINSGSMTLNLTSGNQFTSHPISGVPTTSLTKITIRYRNTGNPLGMATVGFSYGSAPNSDQFSVIPYSLEWKEYYFFATALANTNNLFVGYHASRNYGGSIEVDFIQVGEADASSEIIYPLFNIFHNVPAKSTYLMHSISKGGNVYLDPINYDIPDPVEVPSGCTIRGVRGKTTVTYTGGAGSCFTIGLNKEYIKMLDFMLRGKTPISATTLTIEQIKNREPIGAIHGISMVGISRNIEIASLDINSFSGWGIFAERTHQAYGRTSKFLNNEIRNNGGGILFDTRAEYHNLIGNTVFGNKLGCWIRAGNICGTSNLFTGNGAGLILEGGENDLHGGMSDCLINHNLSYSLFGFNGNNGYGLDNCFLIDGGIYLDNIKGLNINGGQINARITSVNESGTNMISNVFFGTSTGGGQFTGGANLSLKNNRYISGANPANINNNI